MGRPTTIAAWIRRAGSSRWVPAPAPREAPTDWTSRIPAGKGAMGGDTVSATRGEEAIGGAGSGAGGRIRRTRGVSSSLRRSGETRMPNHRRNRLRSSDWIPPRSSKPWWISSVVRAPASPMITSMSWSKTRLFGPPSRYAGITAWGGRLFQKTLRAKCDERQRWAAQNASVRFSWDADSAGMRSRDQERVGDGLPAVRESAPDGNRSRGWNLVSDRGVGATAEVGKRIPEMCRRGSKRLPAAIALVRVTAK